MAGPVAAYQVMTTVIAAEGFPAAQSFTITHKDTAEWMDSCSYYFYVPADTPALNVNLTILSGNARMGLLRPSGEPYYELATYSIDPCKYKTAGVCSQPVMNPEPGVWQVVVENKNTGGEARFAVPNQATFIVDAALLGVRANKTTITLDSGMTNTRYVNNFEFTNYLASFDGGVTTAPLGSSFSARASISEKDRLLAYEVNITPGTDKLTASIGNTSEASSDLDLYIFDCTTGKCVLKDFSQRDRSEELVEVLQPSPGKWKIVVDPFLLPASETTFDYFNVFTNPAFGEITPESKATIRPSGSTWDQRVSVRVDAIPTGSRRLMGFVTLSLRAVPEATAANATRASAPPPQASEIVLRKTMIKVVNAAALVGSR